MPTAAEPGRWLAIPIELPPKGENKRFEIDSLALLLCNVDGEPLVVEDRCPHVRISMEGGLLHGDVIECPMHGGRMNVRDGSPVAMPIRRPGVCYPVRAEGETWLVGLPA